MSDSILTDVSSLKKAKVDRSTLAVLSSIKKFIESEFMNSSRVFVADSVFVEYGCMDRTEVYAELERKGYKVEEIRPCRGEEGGIVISGW
jgi:hypothetical protein